MYFFWIQEGFTAEAPKNHSGANFQGNDSDSGPKVRVTGRKSELQTKSRRYSRTDPQNPNRIAQKRAPNGERKMRTNFFLHKLLDHPQGPGHPSKFSGRPRFLSSKRKEDKLSREGTNFSATTPSRGRPQPHWAVSGPKKLIFVLFFLA